MFVLTIDQRRSRDGEDRIDALLELLRRRGGSRLAAAPERTVGDELQLGTDDAGCALDLLLATLREGRWHVGLGIGTVQRPLPESIRSGTGGAFIAAREAVEAAKASPLGLAVRTAAANDAEPEDAPSGEHLEAMLDLLLALRERRSEPGWEVADLLEAGESQGRIAEQLGITPQAVSLRLRTAGWRLDAAAQPALTTLLRMLDRRLDPPEER